MELKLLFLFAGSLLICVAGGVSILYALAFGFFLFFTYGLKKGHSAREMLRLAVSGIGTVKNILFTFVLIGMITAVWRACGTIPFLVYHASGVCAPSTMLFFSFLLCCLLSFLTGTSLGTAATVGVICKTMADSMGIPPVLSGGAILAGAYFGDRCSPMSTSALLVSDLTGTDIYRNLVNMAKDAAVPFAASCVFYFLAGLPWRNETAAAGAAEIFARSFALSPAAALPAAAIVVLSLFKINVRLTMAVSIVLGNGAALFLQGVGAAELLNLMVSGYHPADAELAALLSGGGILSMAKVFCIVCLSSCYAGMFRGTGFLDGVQELLARAGKRVSPFGTVLLTAVLTSMIACNQALAIMLTVQLCGVLKQKPERFALDLEDTAVVIPPLIPWSVASATPLHAVGAPAACIAAACYLYLLPLWRLFSEKFSRGYGEKSLGRSFRSGIDRNRKV